jgi:hypothetical protein
VHYCLVAVDQASRRRQRRANGLSEMKERQQEQEEQEEQLEETGGRQQESQDGAGGASGEGGGTKGAVGKPPSSGAGEKECGDGLSLVQRLALIDKRQAEVSLSHSPPHFSCPFLLGSWFQIYAPQYPPHTHASLLL